MPILEQWTVSSSPRSQMRHLSVHAMQVFSRSLWIDGLADGACGAGAGSDVCARPAAIESAGESAMMRPRNEWPPIAWPRPPNERPPSANALAGLVDALTAVTMESAASEMRTCVRIRANPRLLMLDIF